MRPCAAILIALALSTGIAYADEAKKPATEIIVNDGVAFSWKENDKAPVVAYDVVSAWKHKEALVADCSEYSTRLKGATWCFANAENLAAFTKKTDKSGDNNYIPFVGGRCTLGMSWGLLDAKGDPRTARILTMDGKDILVLHSAQHWWTVFEEGGHEFARLQAAQMRFDFAKRLGDIVPNR